MYEQQLLWSCSTAVCSAVQQTGWTCFGRACLTHWPVLCAPADAECIVSVIVFLVSRLEKDGNLAETASKLATSIGKQVGLSQN